MRLFFYTPLNFILPTSPLHIISAYSSAYLSSLIDFNVHATAIASWLFMSLVCSFPFTTFLRLLLSPPLPLPSSLVNLQFSCSALIGHHFLSALVCLIYHFTHLSTIFIILALHFGMAPASSLDFCQSFISSELILLPLINYSPFILWARFSPLLAYSILPPPLLPFSAFPLSSFVFLVPFGV